MAELDEVQEKRKKFKVNWLPDEMEEDAEAHEAAQVQRRDLRQKLYQIGEIVDNKQDALQDVSKNNWDDVLESLNATHRYINHTREAQHDAKIMNKLSHTMKNRAMRLEECSQISFKDFCMAAKEAYNECDDVLSEDEDVDAQSGSGRRKKRVLKQDKDIGAMSWTKLGADVGQLFLSPVGLTAMMGPISKPKKVAVARQAKKKDEEVVAKRPEKVESNVDDELNEATFHRIEKLDEVIQKRSKRTSSSSSSSGNSNRDTGAAFAIMDVLYDRSDIVQTMENFFDFAFLIKDGAVVTSYDKNNSIPSSIYADKDKLPAQRKQHVLTLSVKEMREITKYMEESNTLELSDLLDPSRSSSGKNSSDSNPLHRKDKLYDARTALEQTQVLDEESSRRFKRKAQASKTAKSAKVSNSQMASQSQTQSSQMSSHFSQDTSPTRRPISSRK